MQAVSRRHVEWLASSGWNVILVTSRSKVQEDLSFCERVIYIEWPNGPSLYKLNPWNYRNQLVKYSKKVREVIHQCNPSVIYSEGPFLANSISQRGKVLAPIVFHTHGLEMFQNTGSVYSNSRIWPLKKITRDHCAAASAIISQGGILTDTLTKKLKVPASKVKYLPNCVSSDIKVVSESRTKNENRFLFIGRNEARKGLPMLVKSFRHFPNARLDVVGASGELKAPDNVHFHGLVRDRSLIKRFYDSADYLVVPSLAEGMPTVILEAFARGIPVIASDVGAIPELVRSGFTGFLFSKNSKQGLVDSLNQACAISPREYSIMSTNVLSLSKGEFSEGMIKNQLLEIIEEVSQ